MAQVFGNRILGGIGAPGGGMSESFGAGVNTALNQRSARQNMAATAQDMSFRAQDQQFKIEDREEAKRRRAAAEAAAAAARARGVAAIGAIRGGEPFFRLGAPTGGGAVAPARGAPLPFSMGTAAPAGGTITGGGGSATARGTAGRDTLGAPVQNMVRPSLQPAVRQAAGTPTAGYEPTPTQSRFASTGAPSAYVGQSGAIEVPAAPLGRPGGFAARATADRMGAAAPTFEMVTLPAGDGPAGEFLYNRATGEVRMPDGSPITMPGYAETVSRKIASSGQDATTIAQNLTMADALAARAATAMQQGYVDEASSLAAQARQLRAQAQTVAQLAEPVGRRMDRGILAVEGPGATGEEKPYVPVQLLGGDTRMGGTVTIQGPNGAVTVPAGEAAPLPTVAQTQPGQLSFPGVAPMEQTAGAQLGFGPRLGSVASPTEQFLSDVGMAPAGEIDLAALTESYNSPLYDPMFSQLAEQQRTAFAYMAEDAAARGDIGGYIEATAKMREQEMLILTQQLVVGIDEAVNFNSPQRLSAVASMVYGGRDVFIAPKGDGTADVYMDNELVRSGADLNEIATGLRSMVDAEYRSQAAATAAEREQFAYEKQTEADINAQSERELAYGKLLDAVRVDQIRMALEAEGKLPLDPAEYEYREGPNSEVLVIDKLTGQPVAAYSFGVDPETRQTTVTELRLQNG